MKMSSLEVQAGAFDSQEEPAQQRSCSYDQCLVVYPIRHRMRGDRYYVMLQGFPSSLKRLARSRWEAHDSLLLPSTGHTREVVRSWRFVVVSVLILAIHYPPNSSQIDVANGGRPKQQPRNHGYYGSRWLYCRLCVLLVFPNIKKERMVRVRMNANMEIT